MSLNQVKKKIDEVTEKQRAEIMKKFFEETNAIQVKYNVFFRPIISTYGPELEYYALTEQELNKLKTTKLE